jgi:monoamine oxidase
MDDVEVAVVGGGAAGIAAARRLAEASIRCLLIEARPRLGGRAWTVTDASGFAMDLGCGWLHSADRNPWVAVAREFNIEIDTSPPSWARPSPAIGFPLAEQHEFSRAMDEFFARLERVQERDSDLPASAYLDPASRWNDLIVAVGTYISGAEFDRVSAKDLNRYADSHLNWRARGGLGALISAAGAHLPCVLGCPVTGIDHRGRRLKVETVKGTVAADQVIVAIPTTLLAAERLAFTPALADKTAAARGLPLGLADKFFMSLDGAEQFENDTRIFGRTDRVGTGAYQFRPGGAPWIEAYFRRYLRDGTGSRRRWRVLRLRGCRVDRRARQRLCPTRQAAWYPSLGARPVRAGVLFVCATGLCRRPQDAGRARRRPVVFCR